jgi:sugar lactone lactonase YvrE
VGDRSGTIFRVDREGQATTFATLPPSIAAFHLALAPDGSLYVTAPTLASYDNLYRVTPDGLVTERNVHFGRPQGLAFDANGSLYVVEALAGTSGLYRIPADGAPELVLAGSGLIGVAFNPYGGVVVCTGDTAYRLAGLV